LQVLVLSKNLVIQYTKYMLSGYITIFCICIIQVLLISNKNALILREDGN